MLPQSEATILLAEKRIPTATGFQNRSGQLTWNDTILTGGGCTQIHLDEDATLILIPFIGDLQMNESVILEEDQAFVSSEPGNYLIGNPYAGEGINFFEILIQGASLAPIAFTSAVPVAHKPNQWHTVCQGVAVSQWDARVEGTYEVQNPTGQLLAFVLAGAFEVQNRLLQSRDTLLLTQVDVLEFEALSPGAILLVMHY